MQCEQCESPRLCMLQERPEAETEERSDRIEERRGRKRAHAMLPAPIPCRVPHEAQRGRYPCGQACHPTRIRPRANAARHASTPMHTHARSGPARTAAQRRQPPIPPPTPRTPPCAPHTLSTASMLALAAMSAATASAFHCRTAMCRGVDPSCGGGCRGDAGGGAGSGGA